MFRWENAYILLVSTALIMVAPFAGRWGVAFGEAFCFALLLILLLKSPHRLHGPVPPGFFPLVLLIAFTLFQSIPLPSFLVEILSPTSAKWYGSSIWLTEPGAAVPFSVRPKSTLLVFFGLTAGVVAYILASFLLRDRERLRGTVSVLCLLVAWGAIPSLAVLIVPQWDHLRPYIPFTFFAALLPLCLGFHAGTRPETTFGTLRERMKEFFTRPGAYPHLFALLAALLAGAVLLSAPAPWRVGSTFSLLVLALLFLSRPGRRSYALPLLAAAFFIFFGGFTLHGWEWPHSSEPLPSFPTVFGAGMGAAELIPGVDARTMGGLRALLLGGGGIGSVLVGCFLLAFFGKSFMAWRRRKRRLSIAVGASSLAAAAVPIFVAGCTPVLDGTRGGLLFFILAGVAVAATRSSKREFRSTSAIPPKRYGMAAVAFLLLAGNLFFQGGILTASFLCTGASCSPNVLRFDPLEEGYLLELGRRAMVDGDAQTALRHFHEAVRLSPLTGESLQGVALAHKALDQAELSVRLLEASLTLGSGVEEGLRLHIESLFAAKRVAKGRNAVRKALELVPSDTAHYLALLERHGTTPGQMETILPQKLVVMSAYGDYLLSRGLTEQASKAYQRALKCEASEAPNPAEVARIAHWYGKGGRYEEALAAVKIGLQYSPGDPVLRRAAAEFYEKAGLTVRAAEEKRSLKLLRKGG